MKNKILILYGVSCLLCGVSCWTLNDLYNDYVSAITHKKKHSSHHEKRAEIANAWSVPETIKYETQKHDRPLKKLNTIKIKNLDKKDAHGKNEYFNFKPTEGISQFIISPQSSLHSSTNSSSPGKDNDKKHQVTAWTEWSVNLLEPQNPLLKIEHEKETSKLKLEKPTSFSNPTKKDDKHLVKVPFSKILNGDSNILSVSKITSHEIKHSTSKNQPIEIKNNTIKINNLQAAPSSSKSPSSLIKEQVHHALKFKEEEKTEFLHDENIEVNKIEKHNESMGENKSKETIIVKADHNRPSKRKEPNLDKTTVIAETLGEQKTSVSLVTPSDHKRDITELPEIHEIISGNFNRQVFKLHDCFIEATSNVCATKMQINPDTCGGKASFTAVMTRLLPAIELAAASNELIVHGKFDVKEFDIDRCQGRVSFNLLCRELLDIIPNRLRTISSKLMVNFSYEQQPKSMINFNLKINGLLNLDYRNRRLNVFAEKPFGTTLFKIEMNTADLEIPEFTKLFTESEISQQDLPPDLLTLSSSSLRNPRITGLYDSGGAFEFVASAKSPASIFPSQPWVYLIIQKPRLGKVVSGLIASFEGAMYRSSLSAILNLDLSNIPLFSDIKTDMAVGISPDGLFVVKDENFNKEVGTLFSSGRTIRKGLTVKAKLPIQKIVFESLSKFISNQTYPEDILVNMEVKGNKIHIDFPESLKINLGSIPELFSQRGQEMTLPRNTLSIGETQFQIMSYDINNVDKKSITVNFKSPQNMKIGSLMVLSDVEAILTRDEMSKWDFVAKGDCKLGNTSVPISLTSIYEEFVITSKPSSIRSGFLVSLLDKKRSYLTSDLRKYHLDDFVIEDFKVSGSLSKRNIIRFSGKPAVFGVEEGVIEFVATEEVDADDVVVMGLLFKDVDMDNVFGRMLDKKIQRRSWATGVNVGLIVSPLNKLVDFQFESPGLAKTKVQPGVHLRALIKRPFYNLCKGDSLCKVLSSEMPHGSAFHLDGGITNGELKLSAAVDGALYMSKSFEMKDVTFHADVVDNGVQFYVFGSMNPRGVDIPFSGDMRVDNTGQLKLNMISQNSWEEPFGLSNVHLDNCSLSAAFEPGLPLPNFDMIGRLVLGKNSDDAIGIEAVANIKLNLQDPSKNTFQAKIRDLSFEKLASAFGTKQPLLRFQSQARFLDEAIVTFEQTDKENDEIGGEIGAERRDVNSSDFHYKGELKINGRIHLLGENAEYTIKFLQHQTQLLIEVWLPDIGINQGLLTVRAGLKQRSGSETKVSNGPTLLIRMDPQTNSAVVVGKVSTLGFSRISAIKVSDKGFSTTTYASLPGNIKTNISLLSPFQESIQNADFQLAACLPIYNNVKSSLFNLLRNTATQTKKTLISAEERVTTTENIYETTKSMIEKYKKRSGDYTKDIKSMAEVMKKLRNGIRRHCVKDCGDSCMGLPTWRKRGILLGGRNAIGAPFWDSCRHKIPDLNCITRCLGRKVIENVKANNKQIELQKLMSSLADTKRSLQDARLLVNRARNLVDSTLNGLEKVNKEIRVGVDISKFLNDAQVEKSIDVTGICFKDSLDNAERSLIKLLVNGTFHGEPKVFSVKAALDGNLDQNIAEGIADNLYPGFFEFSKNLEQVKMLLSNLDGERQDITKEIDKTTDGSIQTDQKSPLFWTPEEDEYRKLAFGELPRFTLSDDETIHAFEERSLWQIAPSNDPLFDKAPGDNQILANDATPDNQPFVKEIERKTSCDQLKSSVNRYSDIINPLAEFTEDFLQEKIMFYRQKNRRLADLRMIDDQIKSDCFLENCTMEDMDNALSYLGRAKDGTLKWASVIENQIEEQNKVALSYFSKRAEEVIKVDNGVTLRQYISKVKEIAQTAIKKSEVIMHKAETDDKIMKLAQELHSLLIGVKSSEQLSKVAPKIFSMKRQVQSLKQYEVICNQVPQTIKKPLSVDVIENKLREIEKRRNNNKPSSSIKSSSTINPTRRDIMPSMQQSKLGKTLETINNDPDNEKFSSDQDKSAPLTEATNEQSNPRKTVNRDMINRENQPTSSQYSPFTYWNNYIK
ncbi:uncharacterized protein LOC100203318 [Hydra vulgaris]|uniref:uncharacterized protein LOC100203318 n=1 Tax=Hydra vulgaris TaxID=6087 RepID=UPI001F5E8F62|nr:uncharacterized protein LOC100203318 [Hydra vulgaris]